MFTRRFGEPSITSDYFHLLESERAASAIAPDVRSVMKLGWLLLISPTTLWLAWLIVDFVPGDQLASDNRHLLIQWGLAVVALGAWQAFSRSKFLIKLRKIVLLAASVSTAAAATAYVFVGIQAHDEAIASRPERTFELVEVKGRRIKTTTYWHLRVDGSTIEGTRRGRPPAYSPVCTLVQRLDGPNGFSWVRVLERSREPGSGQLAWPIRREDCYSNVPLSSLPR